MGQRAASEAATGGDYLLKKGREDSSQVEGVSMCPFARILNLSSSIKPHPAPYHCPPRRQCQASGVGCGYYSLVRRRTA